MKTPGNANAAQSANTQPPAAGQAAHTPGPFELNEPDRKGVIYIDAPDGTSVASVETRALRNAPEARANAAFIVRACNSHAALVEALKYAAAFFDQANLESPEVAALVPEAPHIGDALRAALAAAKL